MTLSPPAFGPLDAGLPGAGVTPPSMDDLRGALRAPQLPLAFPDTAWDAAERIMDLVRAGRADEARELVRRAERLGLAADDAPTPEAHHAADDPGAGSGVGAGGAGGAADGPDAGRIAYARAVVGLALRTRDQQVQQDSFLAYVDLLSQAGRSAQARATAQVLAEYVERRQAVPSHATSDSPSSSSAPSAGADAGVADAGASGAGAPARAARRPHAHASASPAVPPELLTVVEAHEIPADPSAPGGREITRLRSALDALPAVVDQLLRDPRELLTVRLAEALAAEERLEDATATAFDVLDLETDRLVRGDGHVPEPGRASARAHAVLAHVLAERSPLEAADHAVHALRDLSEVDDADRRVRLVTDLLDALRLAGLPEQADFTAGSLLALQRHLPQQQDRVRPLVAVVRHQISTRQDEAALSTLDEVRGLADETRDRSIRLAAARERARLEHEREDWPAQIRALQELARDARWLVDDLATPDSERERLARDELDALALVMRFSLELGGYEDAHEAARGMIRRAHPDQGLEALGVPLLWDHEVDARVGDLIATGMRLVDGHDGVTAQDYDRLRHEAMVVIGAVPAGHEQRAEYWGVYLDDRHAVLLAARGLQRPARRAARRAREGWARLEQPEQLERMETELRRWLPEG
jgi:hypothetical protein